MRILPLVAVFLLVCAPFTEATICGQYQSEDFSGVIIHTLTEYVSDGGAIQFKITNPKQERVRSMLRGMCYCVEGTVSADPQFKGDDSYRLLAVDVVSYGPFMSCNPFEGRGL